MTEPDEALLYARRSGVPVYQHQTVAEAYRAGAAASAERIKALEARAEELEWALLGMTAAAQNHLHDSAKQHNLQVALKVLKESDQ